MNNGEFQGEAKRHRGLRAAFVAAIAILALLSFLPLRARRPKFALRTCLQDAAGLRPNAPVRIAGVEVGYVTTVRVQDPSCPAAVQMVFATDYDLRIPNDSVVVSESAGILGPAYLGIDISQGSGPPIANGGQLRSQTAGADREPLEKLIRKLADCSAEKRGSEKLSPEHRDADK
jgi:ABC-type transporter Mla subunit MlaD